MQFHRGIPRLTGRHALTIGNFDGVHLGHQAMLERLVAEARMRGVAAAVITFEPHPREYFAPLRAPTRLTSLREKLERFAEHGVDHTCICRFDAAFAARPAEAFVGDLVDRLAPAWLLVGDDFRFGAGRTGDFAMLSAAGRAHDFSVHSLPSITHAGMRVSSTGVRQALAAGDLDAAAAFLGRPYSISGRVVHGDGVGRRLGWPTANVQLQHNRPPLAGIYVVEVEGISGGALPGVASLGVRPTVHEHGAPTLEIHLFDWSGDLYRRHVRVDFLHKIRDERKFPDLDALIAAIAGDVASARAWFDAGSRRP